MVVVPMDAPVESLAGSEAEFFAQVREVAREVAARHAEEVDHHARFPVEAVDALREIGALSAFVPTAFGGGGHSLRVIALACRELGRGCSAAGMVFAMHQAQIGTIARHLGGPWFARYLERQVAERRLIASVTSEIGTGGDMSRSIAAIRESADGLLTFEKRAPTVSYGAYADDLLTTVRRSEDALESDQTFVLHHACDTELEPMGVWDTIGMRGTCSPGFVVRARFRREQIATAPFARMMSESQVPICHILWSHVWLGIATEAFERGRAFVRAAARRSPGTPVPAATSLSRVMSDLSMLRSEVRAGLEDFNALDEQDDRTGLSTMAGALRMNNLKLAASEQAPRVCLGVLEVIGIAAYRNDSPHSVGRQMRDALSARLMVANDRIHATDAGLLMLAKEV
jgi:acyl-CoA dehydrogenase